MVTDKDRQAGGRMQMVWKQKKRTRPWLPVKSLPFTSGKEEEETASSASSADSDERTATGVEGEQPRAASTQFELAGSRETREDLENSQQSEMLLHEGNSLAEERRFVEALGKWEAAIYLTPRKAILYEQKAQLLLEIGKPWNAVQAATCATELRPIWAEAWVPLARAQLNYGEPYLAVESAQTALRLEPDHREASTELERAQFLAIRQHQAVRESTAINLAAEGLQSDGRSSLPSSRRTRVYDSQDFGFGVEHHQIPEREPEIERKEDDNFDKYDEDTYDWVDELKRPAPVITKESLMSDFSDILWGQQLRFFFVKWGLLVLKSLVCKGLSL